MPVFLYFSPLGPKNYFYFAATCPVFFTVVEANLLKLKQKAGAAHEKTLPYDGRFSYPFIFLVL